MKTLVLHFPVGFYKIFQILLFFLAGGNHGRTILRLIVWLFPTKESAEQKSFLKQ
jgi:hypothetical protein